MLIVASVKVTDATLSIRDHFRQSAFMSFITSIPLRALLSGPRLIHGDFANVVFILDDKNKRSLGQHRISPFGVALCAPGLAYRCYILCHQILLRTA
jgi:hypothetical protein